MLHDELLAKIDEGGARAFQVDSYGWIALRAVVELHKPVFAIANGVEGPKYCQQCAEGRGYADYPCPTIQAIENNIS